MRWEWEEAHASGHIVETSAPLDMTPFLLTSTLKLLTVTCSIERMPNSRVGH